MSKQKLFLIAFTILSLDSSIAQKGSQQLLTVVPPSPNVASLGKYGEVPVSLYTGIPNISIPLYEIKDGSLDLPVSLSYHAGGIKVEEIASSVGLSWSLNAGGVVGRNVRGLPDEISNWQHQDSANSIENIMKAANSRKIEQLIKDVDMGDRDGEADIYYFNFSRFSGKFFYDQKGNVHTIPAKNILISQIPGGWKIIAEDGTIYTFNKVEEVSSASCSGDQNIDVAWFLTSIKSPDDKRVITLSYDQVSYTYETLIGQTKYFSVNATGNLCLSNPRPCIGTQHYNTYKLANIDFGDGYVKFAYNTKRNDLMDDKSLDQMNVYDKNHQLIKRFNFGYSYFGDNHDGYNFLTKNLKRLKLVSITEENGIIKKPPYTFEYDELLELPGRLSYAQDHWGYYNGKINNPDLISTFTTTVFSGAQIVFPGADRNANPETAQAGILKKIKYPTGGETLFNYESNTVSDSRIESSPKTFDQVLNFGVNKQPAYSLTYPFESNELIIPTQGAQVQFHVSGLPNTLWQGCDFVQCLIIKDNNPLPFGQIGNSWDGVTATWPAGIYKLRLNSDCGMDAIATFNITINSQSPIHTPEVDIKHVGGLRIKTIEDKPGNSSLSMIKNYRYNPENDPKHSSGVLVNFPDYGYDLSVQSITREAGGQPAGPANYCSYRVRQSFSNYPLATTQGSYVGYRHVIVDLGENGESWHSFNAHSDIAAVYPFAPVDNFDWARGFLLSTKDFIRKNDTLILAREIINTPYSFNQCDVYGIKTGRDYFYIDAGEMPPYLQPLPKYSFFPTKTEAYVLRQTKEKIYDQNDATKFIETVTNYSYSTLHLQLIQTSTLSSKSNQSIAEEIVTNKKYPFDYNFRRVPSGSEASGIKNLQELHVASAVVEEYVIKQKRNTITNQLTDQQVVDGQITTYRSDKPYPDLLFKLEINTQLALSKFRTGSSINAGTFIKNSNTEINNLYKPAVIFNSYDDHGNITTQQKVADVKKSYVWGYDFKYPVAEIVGLDYDSIIANTNLDQAVLQNNSSSDEEKRTELNKIRTKFPAAFVTTYTYKSLVGITSQTDINNRSTYYEYDALGRLILIRDHDKNILKKICYNYQGQPGNCVINVDTR